MKHTLWIWVVLVVAGSVPARADETSRPGPTSHLLNVLHRTNQKEIHMGQLAQEKGGTLQVRSLGEALVRDHQNVDQAIVLMARKEGVSLDPILHHDQRQLRSLTGRSFDKAFARELIREHAQDIHSLLTVNQSPIPAEVQELVLNLVPTLEKHLAWAQQIQG